MRRLPSISLHYIHSQSSLFIRIGVLSILFLVSASLSGCLDIEEQISLNRNGSGSYSITIDMEEVMSMLQSFMEADQSGQLNIFDTMDSTLREQVQTLRGVSGLSNVSHQAEGYTFKISYDFDKVATLNEALSSGGGISGGMGGFLGAGEDVETGPSYVWTKKSFERVQTPIQNLFEATEDEEMAGMMSMAKMMMADASYKITYQMPGKVKKMTNPEAKLSEDKKSVILDVELLDILEGNAELSNKIAFKKR